MKNLMVKNWHKVVVVVLLIAVLVVTYVGLAPRREAVAQSGNILVNPSFGETWYGATGVDGQIPTGWNLWANGQKPATDRYVDSAFTRTPPAWITRGGFVPWVGGGYQTVAVENGATYRFSIYALVYVCNDMATSCIGNGVPRTSEQAIGSKVKVGIDPTGGTDAGSANIIWSALASPYDKFAEIAVEAQALAGSITVFTFNSVDSTPNLRETVWDDASLTKTAASSSTPGAGNATTAPPPPASVPFVSPQAARPDGSVVHTVVQGDTFSSIVVAYRPLGVTRDMVLQANGWDLPPQIISVGQEIIILPPGSVNPTTGQVISLPGGGSVAPAPTAGSLPTAANDGAVTPAPSQVETVNPPAAPPAGGPTTIRPADADAEKGG